MQKLLALITSFLVTTCSATPMSSVEQNEALSVHNQLRSQHDAPALVWNNELAKYAETHASKCQFKHSGSPYGENLAAGYPSVTEAIHTWYAEKKLYNKSHPGFSIKTGHFSQLVWKSTTNLGCAYVTCNSKNKTPGNYLVCEYNPAGNVINAGYFEKNVLM